MSRFQRFKLLGGIQTGNKGDDCVGLLFFVWHLADEHPGLGQSPDALLHQDGDQLRRNVSGQAVQAGFDQPAADLLPDVWGFAGIFNGLPIQDAALFPNTLNILGIAAICAFQRKPGLRPGIMLHQRQEFIDRLAGAQQVGGIVCDYISRDLSFFRCGTFAADKIVQGLLAPIQETLFNFLLFLGRQGFPKILAQFGVAECVTLFFVVANDETAQHFQRIGNVS